MSFRPELIPLDFLPLVLEHLPSRRDLSRCALVNRAFHSVAIPILYRTLDAQIRVFVSFGAVHSLPFESADFLYATLEKRQM